MARIKRTKKEDRRGREFVRRLSDERKRLGLTQAELAVRAGVSIDTIRSIENERVLSPGVFLALDLIRALDGDIAQWLKNS